MVRVQIELQFLFVQKNDHKPGVKVCNKICENITYGHNRKQPQLTKHHNGFGEF